MFGNDFRINLPAENANSLTIKFKPVYPSPPKNTLDKIVRFVQENKREVLRLVVSIPMTYILYKTITQQFKMLEKKIGSAVDPTKNKTRFSDVAGCKEAKLEIMEIVDVLKNRDKYKEIGAEVPRGAILHGPPGNGKTLLAKACAKEASVKFLQCNGSEFIEGFVGLGARRVREVFNRARKNSPCILFIDEIDAVGMKRGGQRSHSENSQTINALLAEMDGFKTDHNVVVIAATNRIKDLDSALTRPGRFNRKIYVGLPDLMDRESIFNIHLNKVKTETDKSKLAKHLATKTYGMSGADISNIVNEAALFAVRNKADFIDIKFFEQAIDRVIAGMAKINDVMDKESKLRIARHEAGHATVGWFLKHSAPLIKVTIVPRTEGALGFAMYAPKDNPLKTDLHLKDEMSVALGGRAAEDVFYDGVVSTGAEDDLQKVTSNAYRIVCQVGMSKKLFNFRIESLHRTPEGLLNETYHPSEATKQNIDHEIQTLIDDQYTRAVQLINDKKDLVEALAQKLIEMETIDRDDVIAILGPRPHDED